MHIDIFANVWALKSSIFFNTVFPLAFRSHVSKTISLELSEIDDSSSLKRIRQFLSPDIYVTYIPGRVSDLYNESNLGFVILRTPNSVVIHLLSQKSAFLVRTPD